MFYHQEKAYLPLTNQRYLIDRAGIVWDGETRVDVVEKNGEKFIKLDWFNGVCYYRYCIIPVICFFNIQIPKKYHDRIMLIFKDGNNKNYAIDNLAYYFKDGPIESDIFPGYYYVPYYTDYLLNKNGDVISLKLYRIRGKVHYKKWTISKPVLRKNIKGGYRCGRGKRDCDGVDRACRHRFIALTFIPYTSDPLSLVVNHKNGIPGDDRIDNLEWATYSENTKHAYDNNLHPNKVKKIVFLNSKGIEKHYPTIASCAEDNGFSCSFIYGRLLKQNIDYGDGIRFKLDDGDNDWEEITGKGTASGAREVAVRNVFTGETWLFKNALTAEYSTGINSSTILLHCKNESTVPIYGLNFRYSDEGVFWPFHSTYHLQMYKCFPKGNVPNGVLLLDDRNDIKELYETYEKFCKEWRVSNKKLYSLFKTGESFNGFFVRKFDVKATM